MFIESNFLSLPGKTTTKNSVVVAGGVVSRYASSLNQLSQVKMAGHCFYYVSRFVSGNFCQSDLTHKTLNKGSQDYNFIFASTPVSTHLVIVVRYAAANHTIGGSNSPTIEISLEDNNKTIDAGIKFEYPIHLNQEGFNGKSRVFEVYSGLRLSTPSGGSHLTQTPPRPLFIPTANRGNVLNIIAVANDCSVLAIDVFEVYREII